MGLRTQSLACLGEDANFIAVRQGKSPALAGFAILLTFSGFAVEKTRVNRSGEFVARVASHRFYAAVGIDDAFVLDQVDAVHVAFDQMSKDVGFRLIDGAFRIRQLYETAGLSLDEVCQLARRAIPELRHITILDASYRLYSDIRTRRDIFEFELVFLHEAVEVLR